MDQAACLDPLLRHKCRQLAALCRGAFRVDTAGAERQFESYDEPTPAGGREQGAAHKWLWAGVKPAERALEKLLRSYDCDPSRLLDCCRQVQPAHRSAPSSHADCLAFARRLSYSTRSRTSLPACVRW